MIKVRDIATALNMTPEAMLDMDARDFAREVNALTALLEAELSIMDDPRPCLWGYCSKHDVVHYPSDGVA